jgi:hypothetical protein
MGVSQCSEHSETEEGFNIRTRSGDNANSALIGSIRRDDVCVIAT